MWWSKILDSFENLNFLLLQTGLSVSIIVSISSPAEIDGNRCRVPARSRLPDDFQKLCSRFPPGSRFFQNYVPDSRPVPDFSKIMFPVPARSRFLWKLSSRFPPVPDFFRNEFPVPARFRGSVPGNVPEFSIPFPVQRYFFRLFALKSRITE